MDSFLSKSKTNNNSKYLLLYDYFKHENLDYMKHIHSLTIGIILDNYK
jgi:hypothetical protein